MFVSATRWDGRAHRVLLDGQDVSNVCFEADDILGYVGIYKTGPNGKVERGLNGVERIYVKGTVVITEATKSTDSP